jgi:hypothetical protein
VTFAVCSDKYKTYKYSVGRMHQVTSILLKVKLLSQFGHSESQLFTTVPACYLKYANFCFVWKFVS